MKTAQTFRVNSLLLCLLLLTAPFARAQQQKPAAPVQDEPEEVIRLDTELIQVQAVVTDKKGQPVDGLTRDDFEVFEDGQPRALSFFAVERAPSPGEATAADAAPKPNRAAPARTFVLFVDTLHLAPTNLHRAKLALRKFVDEMMTDRDSVAVVTTDGTLGLLQQFTSDRAMLRRAIDKIQPFLKPTTRFTPDLAARVRRKDDDSIGEAISILHDEEGYESIPPPTIDEAVALNRARDILGEEERLRYVTLQALEAVSERLAKMKGQRILAYVSNGFSSFDQGGAENRVPLQKVLGHAARAGIVVYPLYGIGLYAGGHAMNGMPSEASVSTLKEMADATGGRAFLNTNDMGESFQKMLEANVVSYALAYYPPKGGDPAKFRKITVRLKNHPEYGVRAQKGYLPPELPKADAVAATPRERMLKEIMAPLPATALDVSAAAYFLEREGDDAQVTLRVHMGGDRLSYAVSGEDRLLRCEVVALFIDKDGTVAHTVAETMTATLTPAQLAEARRIGYRYTRRLNLKPGLYQVRVGMREMGSELLGTTSAWVEIPNLSDGRVALSSLFVGAEAGDVAGGRRGAARLIVDGPVGRAGETLSYRFVVYNPQPPETPAGADASLKIEILRGEAQVYEGEWQPLASRAKRHDASGTEAGGQLRLDMPPGLYTLRVSARDARSQKTAVQTINFEVVP
jgi:VWFA-related protein